MAAVGWSLWEAGVGRGVVLNPGGWPVAARFARGALAPDLSSPYLTEVARATFVTVAYAVLGTVAALVLGVVGGVLTSRTAWRLRAVGARDRAAAGRGGWQRRARTGGWLLGRVALVLPRGIHEAVWGLLLVVVLGPDPLAAVLAIAIPYGAITAKVFADLLDDAARAPTDALLAAGARTAPALAYGLVPRVVAGMVSYGLYRFDCALRAAVVLGIVGAGGLGLLLTGAVAELAYSRMWTAVYALVAVCALGDVVSRRLRRRVLDPARSGRAVPLAVGVVVAVAAVASWLGLGVDLGALRSGRAGTETAYVASAAWPPRLPDAGAGALVRAAVETLQMSLVAVALAVVVALAVAPVAARLAWAPAGPAQRSAGALVRLGLLLARAVPSPVWALVLLFVVLPGPLPGALALGVYTAGVLGRLVTEVVEDLDPRPARALQALGAPRPAVVTYGLLPRAAARTTALSAYRWEVAVRETVVVGLVGAGGLGYLLSAQLAAFDWRGALGSLVALVLLILAVDLVGAAVRRAAR